MHKYENMLNTISSYLNNEDLLIKNSTPGNDNFNIRTLLSLIEKKDTLNPDFYPCQVESETISFLKYIRSKSEYNLYAVDLALLLEQQPISVIIINSIKSLLLKMQKEFFSDQEEEQIVIRNLQ